MYRLFLRAENAKRVRVPATIHYLTVFRIRHILPGKKVSMNLYSYKNAFANIFSNEFCFYMILASCFRRTQCMSAVTLNQLSLYYADLVRDNSGYDRQTGQWRTSYSYVRQERLEDLYIPLIEGKLVRDLAAIGWDLSSDQAEVFIEPAMKIVEIRKDSRNTKGSRKAIYGHIFHFKALYNELFFQVVEEDRHCRVLIRIRRIGCEDILYLLAGKQQSRVR